MCVRGNKSIKWTQTPTLNILEIFLEPPTDLHVKRFIASLHTIVRGWSVCMCVCVCIPMGGCARTLFIDCTRTVVVLHADW